MPVRFQVDPDFYDHPKAIGMSDSATALWTRAGSYSVAKLLDGFVPEHALSLLSTAPDEAASELVARGLWRRVRGGYRFHQWDQRNLTKARVEADRDADRQRKRRERKTARQNVNPQVDPGIVRPDTGPDSDRNPNGIRGVSVSVSESVSVSGSGHPAPAVENTRASPVGPEPPRTCPDHEGDPKPPPCGGCRDARLAWDAWDRARILATAERRSDAARDRATANAAAIAACPLCDVSGYRAGRVCSHDPDQDQRITAGAAKARAAIGRHHRTDDQETAP